jgi:hypothetical protein
MIKTRTTLLNLINQLTDECMDSEKKRLDFESKSNETSSEYTSQIETLVEQSKQNEQTILEKDKSIKQLQKDKHEYEQLINKLNEKIQEMQTEQESSDRHDMIKVQAKQIDEKDRIIDQLQDKILKLKNDTTLEEKALDPVKKVEQIVNDTEDDGIPEVSGTFEQVEEQPKQLKQNEQLKQRVIKPKKPQPFESSELVEEQTEQLASTESEDDDEVWIKVKHKGTKYIIVKGEQPQNVYEIDEDGSKGKRVGTRTESNGRKKYKFD